MSDPRVELIELGFDAWERGDVETALSYYDPEVVVFAPPEVGNPGTFHGHEGFMQWVTAWYEAWDPFEQELLRIEPVGDTHVLAVVNQRGTGRGSGVEIEREATWVFDVRDERLIYMALYFDHAQAEADARERETATAD
jgi:ketosteroid isomerase-like protein